MENEFLAKMKVFRRSSVIYSNANPYAAAAAMGNAMARSQEAGPYFHPSDTFIPEVGGFTPGQTNTDSAPTQIHTDFQGDWVAYLRTPGLPACGLNYDEHRTPEENTMRFLNANRRRTAEKPRTVYKSRELSIPVEYQSDYEKLVLLIEAGNDLNPYLSRDIIKRKRPDKNDGLLNSWGVQHLHYRTTGGTNQLLFCIITESYVFLIQSLPHNEEYLWVNTKLVQILHNNWPEMIACAKHSGLHPETFTSAKRHSLRRYNTNFPVTVTDGTVYLPLAGGVTSFGDSLEDRVNCDKIFSELKHWQDVMTQNALLIRSALNMPVIKKVIIRMAFNNRHCCFYEPTQGIRLGGFSKPHEPQ